MPCFRPQVAPSHAAVWITDDLLAAAWCRFTHVYNNNSSSQRHRIDGGRRHGSNVPGPLEARRRLAKRRMGLASHSQPPSGSGLADFGAFLFGTRGVTRQDAERGWKWEAPKPQQAEVNGEKGQQSAWAYVWPGGTRKRKEEDAWERFLEVPGEEDIHNTPKDSSEMEVEGLDPATVSSNAFGELLASLESVRLERLLETDDMADVVAFLQSTADETEAKNTSRLVQWLWGRTENVSGAAIMLVVDVMVNKIRLGTLSVDESALILKELTHALGNPQHRHWEALMQALQDRDVLSEVCATTTRLLVEESTTDDQPSPAILVWLRCLRLLEKEGDMQFDSVIWQDVYQQLSRRYTRAVQLSEHLSKLDRFELATVLLHYWVPHILASSYGLGAKREVDGDTHASHSTQLTQQPVDARTDQTLTGAVNIADMRLPNSDSFYSLHLSFPASVPPNIERLEKDWKSSRRYIARNQDPDKALVALLCVLAYHRVPYADLASDIFSIFICPSSSMTDKDVFRIYRKLRGCQSLGISSRLAGNLVNRFVARKALRYAHYVFTGVPILPLSHCHSLPLALAADSRAVHSSKVYDVLNRITTEDYTPRAAMYNANQPLILPPSHIDLVHRVAFLFAKQEYLRPRVAFRRIWECYRFLQDRSAPIRSLISRAMVTAAVIRPLKMRRRIPTESLKYVLHVVERVEGKKVAEEVDRVVWEVWEGEVLPALIKEMQEFGAEVLQKNEHQSPQWRSVAWAGHRRGVNTRYWHPKTTAIAESGAKGSREDEADVPRSSPRAGADLTDSPALKDETTTLAGSSDRYEPFAFSDTDADALRSSPRAGADLADVPASQDETAVSACSLNSYEPFGFREYEADDASTSSQRAAANLADFTPSNGNSATPECSTYSLESQVSRNALIAGEITPTDADVRSAQAENSVRRGLGYNASAAATLEHHDESSTTNGLDRRQGAFSRPPVHSPPSALDSVEDLASTMLDLNDPVLNKKRKAGRSKMSMTPREASVSTSTTEASKEISTAAVTFAPCSDTSTTPAAPRVSMSISLGIREITSPSGDLIEQRLVKIHKFVAGPAVALFTADGHTDPHPTPASALGRQQRLAGPFPIYWEGQPCSFDRARSLISHFEQNLHSERAPTDAEMEFKRSFYGALGSIVDGARSSSDERPDGFPFLWGDVEVSKKMGIFASKHVVDRASAEGRQLVKREQIFLQLVKHRLI